MDCLDIETSIGCRKNGAGAIVSSVVIHYEYRKNALGNTVLHSTRYTNAVGAPITLAAGDKVEPGACVAEPIPAPVSTQQKEFAGGKNYASGVLTADYDPDGNGATWSPSGPGTLDSFTVLVLKAGKFPASPNRVVVRFGALGERVFLTDGVSETWSISQDSYLRSDFIDTDIIVEAQGDSAFIVSYVWKP